jgi:hypothetical protein
MIAFPTFRGGLAGFSPISLAPAVWYSDTGSDESQWDDISGNGRHATQATSGFRPSIQTNVLNGKQVRRFDGTNDFFSMGSSTTLLNSRAYAAVFTVAKANATTTGVNPAFVNFLWASTSFGRFSLGLVDSPSQFRSFGRRLDSDSLTVSTQTRTSDFSILTAESVYSSGTQRLGVNSNYTETAMPSSGTSGAGNSLTPDVGRAGTAYLNGDMAEVLIYNTPLTTTERRRIEIYLAIKYNITAALP